MFLKLTLLFLKVNKYLLKRQSGCEFKNLENIFFKKVWQSLHARRSLNSYGKKIFIKSSPIYFT